MTMASAVSAATILGATGIVVDLAQEAAWRHNTNVTPTPLDAVAAMLLPAPHDSMQMDDHVG